MPLMFRTEWEVAMQNAIIEHPDCVGSLSWAGYTLAVRFAARCTSDGTISVKVEPIPANTPEARALLDQFHERGLHATDHVLVGNSSTGETVRCEPTWLRSCSPRPEGRTTILDVELHCPSLVVSGPRPAQLGDVPPHQYWVAGLCCFGVIQASFDFGDVTVIGTANFTPEISGRVTVQPKAGMTRDQIDEGIDRVLDVLGVAGGLRLSWSIREVAEGSSREVTIVSRASVAPPTWPAFDRLDLQPLFTCAGANYTRELVERTGIGLAIKWGLAASAHEEVAFVQLSIAVEHLVDRYGDSERADLTKAELRGLRACVRMAMDGYAAWSSDDRIKVACAEFAEASAHLNRPMKKRIAAMLAAYSVPTQGLTHYPDLVDLRNAIVHTGVPTRPGRPLRDVMEGEAALRELLVRTFLALISFKGRYRSWLEGPTWAEFPAPAEVQVSVPDERQDAASKERS